MKRLISSITAFALMLALVASFGMIAHAEGDSVVKYLVYGSDGVSNTTTNCSSLWAGPVYDSNITSVGGKSEKLSIGTNLAGGYWAYQINQMSFSDIADNGYFEFLMYTDAAQVSDLPTFSIASQGTKWGTKISLADKVELNQWNSIKIRLKDIISGQFDISKVFAMRSFMPSEISAKYNIYIQNMQFTYTPQVVMSQPVQNNDKVSLSWNFDGGNADSYNVYCNGVFLENTPFTELEEDIIEYNVINEYYVEAVNTEGEVISTSEKKNLAIYSTDIYAHTMLYGTSGANEAIVKAVMNSKTWGGFSNYSSAVTAVGGKSKIFEIKTNYATAYIKYDLNSKINLTEIMKDGYLQFLVYPETEDDMNSLSQIQLSGSNTKASVSVTANQWNFVSIKLSDLIESNKTSFETNGMSIYLPASIASDYKLYVQNLGFYGKIIPPAAEVTANGIDENGNSYAEIKFDKAMDEATLEASAFTDDNGASCESVEYNEESHTVKVIFDTQLVFPKEYNITIADTVTDTFSRSVQNPELSFTTHYVQNQVFAKNITVDKSQAETGVISCTADVTAIYEPKGMAQDVIMAVVVYSGDKVLGIGYDELNGLGINLKESKSLAAQVTCTELAEYADHNISVFFINSTDSIKPLCDVYTE